MTAKTRRCPVFTDRKCQRSAIESWSKSIRVRRMFDGLPTAHSQHRRDQLQPTIRAIDRQTNAAARRKDDARTQHRDRCRPPHRLPHTTPQRPANTSAGQTPKWWLAQQLPPSSSTDACRWRDQSISSIAHQDRGHRTTPRRTETARPDRAPAMCGSRSRRRPIALPEGRHVGADAGPRNRGGRALRHLPHRTHRARRRPRVAVRVGHGDVADHLAPAAALLPA